MRIQASAFTIAELRDSLNRDDLIINRGYQRGSRLWPAGPRSYFIDTILEGFPFPKMYFYEDFDRSLRRTRREIVDGQQRVTAIADYLEDRFALTTVSRRYAGMKFSDLDEDVQISFLQYSVPVDIILNAEKADILEMFRRMNSYTLPLNEAEKRHSAFEGPFKWFITQKSAELYPVFSEFGIFTERQIVRMDDAELLVEIIDAIKRGIVSSSNKILSDIYEEYERIFPEYDEYNSKLSECFDFISSYLGHLRKSPLMKPYAVHSLCTALLHNKYGIPNGIDSIGPVNNRFAVDINVACEGLETLARAHEAKETDGPLGQYVWGCSGATTRALRREARVLFMYKALEGRLF